MRLNIAMKMKNPFARRLLLFNLIDRQIITNQAESSARGVNVRRIVNIIFQHCAKILKNRTFEEFFTGMFNKRIGQVILKMAGFKLNQKAYDIDDVAIGKIAHIIKGMEFAVTGTTGFANAQVTAGGLKTKQFSHKTMESLDCKNLYCVGEILDIDGDCGGFNLQWAWSSAMCAVDAIIGGNK
jgi:predicted flavoprotein YhiN